MKQEIVTMIFQGNDPTLKVSEYRDCITGCVCMQFERWGYRIKEYTIFFAGGGLVNRDCIDSNIKLDFHGSDVEFIGFSMDKCISGFMGKAEVNHMAKKAMSYKEKITVLQQCNENVGIIIAVDPEILSQGMHFQLMPGMNHFLSVIRADISAGKVYIIDPYLPGYPPNAYEGWIDIDKLIDAWNMSGGAYQQLYKDHDWEMPLFLQEDTKEHKSWLQEIIHEILSKKHLVEIQWQRLKNICDIISKCDMDSSHVELKELLSGFNYICRNLGLLASRYMIRDALDDICSESNVFHTITDEWEKCLVLSIKAAYSQKRSWYEKFVRRLEELLEHEKELWEMEGRNQTWYWTCVKPE